MSAGIVLGIGGAFGQGDPSGSLYEGRELPIGDGRGIDPETIDLNRAAGGFFRIVTTDPTKPLSLSAERRLQVLQSLDNLGAGFRR